MFSVVACPRCGAARGVRSSAKGTSCPRCSKRFALPDARVVATAETEADLASAVAAVNADGASAADGAPVAGRRIAAAKRNLGRADVRRAILELTGTGIDHQQLGSALAQRGVPEAVWSRELAALLCGNELFEPRPGSYRRP